MKVLLISHNSVSPQTNMGKTFLSLFSQFTQEELCQLYIYPTVPNVDRCTSYYRVTDKEVLASFFKRTKIGGEIDRALISETQGTYENPADESLYRNRKNKSAVRRLLRDLMWAMSGWYSADLRTWLDREEPDCIFVAPGAAKFLYNMALRIAKDRKIPIVTYICDEYYFVKKPRYLLERLRLKLLQKKIETLLEHSTHLLVISQELKEAYEKKFRIPTTVLMTGSGYTIAEMVKSTAQPAEISYFGNIRCNRFVNLAEIGRELDAINRDLTTDYKLKIYTGEKDPEILGVFHQIQAVKLCGFVSGATFDRTFGESQLLLHTEAFDRDSIDFTQHSVSTKIADSLASGIPLLAYGPGEISSMKHLLRNDCAIVATEKEDLRPMLMTAFSNGQARDAAAENGLKAARKYHESTVASRQLREIILRNIK